MGKTTMKGVNGGEVGRGRRGPTKDICPLLSSGQRWAVWRPNLSQSPIASGLLTGPSLEGPSSIMAAVSSERSPRLQALPPLQVSLPVLIFGGFS